MFEDDYNEGDITEYRNAISPVCSECGAQLDEDDEKFGGLCAVCWEWNHR